MRSKAILGIVVVVCVMAVANVALADTFDAGGANEFTIDFVNISGDTNPISGYGIVNNDYHMGTYEITNDQWNKFTSAAGAPTGYPSDAYDGSTIFAGTDVPTTNVSWYEAAQFVNYLNTSTGHQAAYKFTGTQGTGDYTFDIWSSAEASGGTNLYRHKDAFYFLPTEDEWVKAGYWNGTNMQDFATKPGDTLYQGNGSNGGWNYYDYGYATDPVGPWAVGTGSEELNGTFDIMGNVREWMENPYSGGYVSSTGGVTRSGAYLSNDYVLDSSYRRAFPYPPENDGIGGFRVASVPEPATLLLLGFGAILLRRRCKV